MDELRPDHIPASGPRILGFQNTAQWRRDGGDHGAGQTPAGSRNIADRIVGVVRHEGILL